MKDRGRGLNGNVMAGRLEGIAQRHDVRHDHRLAAGDHDVAGPKRLDALDDLLNRNLLAFRVPACVGRVAPDAAQIAAAGAHEYGRHAHELAFALDGVEQFR